MILESWPPISFGKLKLEIYENNSQDHTNPVLVDLVRENMDFFCTDKSEICVIESESEPSQIIQAIEYDKLNETVTKITINFEQSNGNYEEQ